VAVLIGDFTIGGIDHAADATIADLTSATMILWIRPTNVAQTFRTIAHKLSTWPSGWVMFRDNNTAGIINLDVPGNTNYLQIHAASGTLSAGVDHFVAFTWAIANAATANHLYVGTPTTAPVEASYVTRTAWAGTRNSDSALSVRVGNNHANDNSSPASYSAFAIWDRELTLPEIIQQYKRLHRTQGNVLLTHYGIHGASGVGTQQDWSGNGNHGTIVTGATKTDHAPIQIFPRPRNYWAGWAAAGYPGPFPLSRPVFN